MLFMVYIFDVLLCVFVLSDVIIKYYIVLGGLLT